MDPDVWVLAPTTGGRRAATAARESEESKIIFIEFGSFDKSQRSMFEME